MLTVVGELLIVFYFRQILLTFEETFKGLNQLFLNRWDMEIIVWHFNWILNTQQTYV